MSWDAIGAIAELAGALGVIASLIYLATQIRHSTRASAVEAKLATTGMLSEFTRHFTLTLNRLTSAQRQRETATTK